MIAPRPTLGLLTPQAKAQLDTLFSAGFPGSVADTVNNLYRVVLQRSPNPDEFAVMHRSLDGAPGYAQEAYKWARNLVASEEHQGQMRAAGIPIPANFISGYMNGVPFPGSGLYEWLNSLNVPAPPPPPVVAAPQPAATPQPTTPSYQPPVTQNTGSGLPGQGTTRTYEIPTSGQQTSSTTPTSGSSQQRTTSTGSSSSTVITVPGAGSSPVATATAAMDRAKDWFGEQPWYVLAGIAAAIWYAASRRKR